MMDEDTGLKPAADIQAIDTTPAPVTENPRHQECLAATRSGEIHTIESGTLDTHQRNSTCWCMPTQSPDDSRIYVHRTAEELTAIITAVTGMGLEIQPANAASAP